jgi:superoxide dismutase, Cu-Zn family
MSFYKNILPAVIIILCSIIIFSCNNDENNTVTTESSDSLSNRDTTLHDMNKMRDTTAVPKVAAAEAIISGTYPDTVVNGTAKFETTANGSIKMTLAITVLAKANKSVAVHIHEHGDCGDNGNASHGHWNPTKSSHGKWGSDTYHSGDIGNVKLDAKGKGTITITTDLWTLGGWAFESILGKAIIVHGGVDDYTTQPTGDAGNRIGCGLIVAK